MLELGGRSVDDCSVTYDVVVDPLTGAASLRVPVPVPPGRAGFAPELALVYTSSGNSAFGVGWTLAGVQAVAIDTSDHVPRWDGSDGYAFGGEPLVPWLEAIGPSWQPRGQETAQWSIAYYRVRTGSASQRIEKWVDRATGRVQFRARDAANTLAVFGSSDDARVADPDDAARTLTWLPELVVDAAGNAQRFEYLADGPQRYLRRVSYGNTAPVSLDGAEPPRWCFQVVLDYTPRADEHASHRAGFALPTRLRCARIASYHDFDELGATPTLVGSLTLVHDDDPAGAALRELVWTGYRNDGTSIATPALRMTYAAAGGDSGFIAAPSENAPAGLDAHHLVVDLYGDGLPGILSESDRTWFYKPNLGGGQFGAQTLVRERPLTQPGTFAFGDADRDGDVDLSLLAGRFAGSFAHDRARGRWQPFRPFAEMPHVEALGGRVDRVDLDGDGRPDLVVAKGDHLVWFASRNDGFAAPVEIPLPATARSAPTVGEEPALDLFFADMDGDGLVDLVRVENGRVEYWPSLGNGRFGDGIVLDGGPLVPDDGFDPRRVRFVDLDGSGTSDLVYIGRGEVFVWMNASGRRLMPGPRIRGLPFFDNVSTVQVLDVLGDGRPCLVWSSPLPGHTGLHYLPLAPAVPPRLLLAIDDGLGIETRLTHGSSAAHYLRDVASGRGWSALLPDHVTVVDRREVFDRAGGTRRVERFEYHDGVFDGVDRVFRGFAQVDVYDAEAHDGGEPGPDEPAFAPPLATRTWFHVGVPPWGPHRPIDTYAADAELPTLVAHVLDDGDLEPAEADDAVRTLAGRPIRIERFAIDEKGLFGEHPFDVVQMSYRVRRTQPATPGARAAFAVIPVDTLTATYEQFAGDPRVTHEIVVETDAFDHVVRHADIAYPRRAGKALDVASQGRLDLVIRDRDVVHVDDPDRFQLGVLIESRECELFGVAQPSRARLRDPDVAAALAAPTSTDGIPPADVAARRIAWERSVYWNDGRTGPSPLGEVAVPALLHHVESACFTPALVASVFGARVDGARLVELGYVLRDEHWWRLGDVELVGTPALFLLPPARDGGRTRLDYDRYALHVVAETDAAGNRTEAVIDYHVLAPTSLADPNGNIHEIHCDAVGVAVMSSEHGHLGSAPWGFAPLAAGLPARDATSALADPAGYLAGAATATIYDLDAWRRDGTPTRLITLVREAVDDRIQIHVSYIDGSGQMVQTKTRVDDRWRSSGYVVFDGKLQPALAYEPYFSADASYDGDAAMRQIGPAVLTRYDATGREVGQNFPDGAFTRTSYNAWSSEVADRNDTVLDSTYRALRETLPAINPERRALDHAKTHANTTSQVFVDARGREVGTLARGGAVADRRTETRLDASGEATSIVDPRGIVAYEVVRDMLGRVLRVRSTDGGESTRLADGRDRIVLIGDARGVEVEQRYDELDRPIATHVRGFGLDHEVEQRVYGDSLPDDSARANNLKAQLAVLRDHSGETTIDQCDPNGAVTRSHRRLRNATDEPDWRTAVTLDDAVFTTEVDYDAIGRARVTRSPDGLIRRVDYAASGGVERMRVSSADGRLAELDIVAGADYAATGDQTLLRLGNGVDIAREFHADTLRLAREVARRGTRTYRDLAYTYDPAGNLIIVDDRARDGERNYAYDAHYRLIRATGRVHQALLEHDVLPPHISLTNAAAVEPYTRTYERDASGNLTALRHAGRSRSWSTEMWISPTSNRSQPARDGNGVPIVDPESAFDTTGNLIAAAHLRRLDWSWRGSLARAVVIERPGSRDDDEVYSYNADGTRARKLATRVVTGDVVETTETSYFGDCRRTQVRRGDRVIDERWSSFVGDVAVVHLASDATSVRYRLVTHDNASAIEVDDGGELIAYEEYFPYGGTALIAGDVDLDSRYAGRERDDVTGLYDFGQRYYAPWMARWLSPDPIGPEDDLNLYQYVLGDPIGNVDENGLETTQKTRYQKLLHEIVITPRGYPPAQFSRAGAVRALRDLGLRFSRLRGANGFYEARSPKGNLLVVQSWPSQIVYREVPADTPIDPAEDGDVDDSSTSETTTPSSEPGVDGDPRSTNTTGPQGRATPPTDPPATIGRDAGPTDAPQGSRDEPPQDRGGEHQPEQVGTGRPTVEPIGLPNGTGTESVGVAQLPHGARTDVRLPGTTTTGGLGTMPPTRSSPVDVTAPHTNTINAQTSATPSGARGDGTSAPGERKESPSPTLLDKITNIAAFVLNPFSSSDTPGGTPTGIRGGSGTIQPGAFAKLSVIGAAVLSLIPLAKVATLAGAGVRALGGSFLQAAKLIANGLRTGAIPAARHARNLETLAKLYARGTLTWFERFRGTTYAVGLYKVPGQPGYQLAVFFSGVRRLANGQFRARSLEILRSANALSKQLGGLRVIPFTGGRHAEIFALRLAALVPKFSQLVAVGASRAVCLRCAPYLAQANVAVGRVARALRPITRIFRGPVP